MVFLQNARDLVLRGEHLPIPPLHCDPYRRRFPLLLLLHQDLRHQFLAQRYHH